MLVAPANISDPNQTFPAELLLTARFLQTIKLNFPGLFSKELRDGIRFLAEPKTIVNVNFRTVESTPSMQNLTASWNLSDISEANAIVMFNSHVFTSLIKMDSFSSQSWAPTVLEFQPMAEKEGVLTFGISMERQNMMWSISTTSGQTKPQSYSPSLALARIKMSQKVTPYQKTRRQG